MVTRTEAQRMMAELLGFSYHKIKLIGEQLAKENLIESKGRGRYGVNLTPESMSVLFLAVCGSETNTDAPRVVRALTTCISNPVNRSVPVTSALADIFSDPMRAARVFGVDVCRSTPEVKIDSDDGVWSFRPPEYWNPPHKVTRPGGIVWAMVAGEVIHGLAVTLQAK